MEFEASNSFDQNLAAFKKHLEDTLDREYTDILFDNLSILLSDQPSPQMVASFYDAFRAAAGLKEAQK